MSSTTQYIFPLGAIVPCVGVGYLKRSNHFSLPGWPFSMNGFGASRYLSIGTYHGGSLCTSCQTSSTLIWMTSGACPETSCVTSHSRASAATPTNSMRVSG
jgi:hypothetical protein